MFNRQLIRELKNAMIRQYKTGWDDPSVAIFVQNKQ